MTRLLLVFALVAALAPVTASADPPTLPYSPVAGPPTPEPTINTALHRLRGAFHKACLRTQTLVVAPGDIPIGYTGKCIRWRVSRASCVAQAWKGAHRWVCTGWIIWETTPYTTGGPCWSSDRFPPPGTYRIRAVRDGYVWAKAGAVKHRMLPGWRCYGGVS